MKFTLQQPFLMVITSKERPGGFEDNVPILVVEVDLFDKYEDDSKRRRRCRYKKVFATTDTGVRFLLWDDDNKISNARQYGSENDPHTWGEVDRR